MCFYCYSVGRILRLGPLVVAATDINGRPMIYCHQECVDEAERKVEQEMHKDQHKHHDPHYGAYWHSHDDEVGEHGSET